MNTHKPTRSQRVEHVIRIMLGLLLLAAVVWAVTNGDGEAHGFDLSILPGW